MAGKLHTPGELTWGELCQTSLNIFTVFVFIEAIMLFFLILIAYQTNIHLEIKK